MPVERFCFARESIGETLYELGYDQIGADARFIFDRPIVIAPTTLIEYDALAGTFCAIRSDGRREQLSGKWDR